MNQHHDFGDVDNETRLLLDMKLAADEREQHQIPEGAGYVFWAVVGMGIWAVLFDVLAVVRGWV